MRKISLINLYWTFFKIGAILLGGGFVILPILKEELACKKQLIQQEDLVNYFTISQSMPGLVATNISILTGYKIRGVPGAIIATFGIITMPCFSIILLASVFDLFANNIYVAGAMKGVGVAVLIMISLTIIEIAQNSKKDFFFALIMAISLLLLFIFKFSPIQVILSVSLFGVILKKLINKKGDNL